MAAPKSCLVHVAAFLKHLTHDEFVALLPTLQKSLLRNPETILQAVSHLLSGLSIDLSRYIEDLANSICTHLVSQRPELRADAVVAVETIAKQCSDSTAVEVRTKPGSWFFLIIVSHPNGYNTIHKDLESNNTGQRE